ncbi:MAG TPA: COX15/CtaA family protein [Chloroflexota bacterium]
MILATTAWLAATSTFLLIVLGGFVRASGSGLGCPDWPLCHGQVFPSADLAATIEYSHRILAGITTILVLITAAQALIRARSGAARWLGIAAPIVLAGQIALGAISVLFELPPFVVLAHLGVALLLLGVLILLASLAPVGETELDAASADARPVARLALGAALSIYLLALTGAYVQATGASGVCPGWPTCDTGGGLGSGALAGIHMLHRIVALLVAGHVVATVARAWRVGLELPSLRKWGTALGAVLILQIAIGGMVATSGLAPLAQVLHIAGSAATWGAAAALAGAALRLSMGSRVQVA